MSKVTFQISMSLDGFIAGPNQSVEEPLGHGGEALHEWVVALEAWRKPHGMEGGLVNASSAVVEETTLNVGAYVMGRNMFGGGPGPWREPAWNGWWGANPPFHTPVFVLTHYPRPPLELDGGTTFHFVQDGIEDAIKRAKNAAGDRDVTIGGGAQTVQQALRAGLVDSFWLHVVPVVLGDGARLIENIGDLKLTQREIVPSDGVAHIAYDVTK